MKHKIIDLKQYLNHKNCSTINNPNIEIGVNGFYVADKKIHSDLIQIENHGITFDLYGAENAFDNIICSSQKIDVNSTKKYSKLALIGFSEFNNSFDSITLISENKSEKINFGFYNIFSIKAEFSDYNDIITNSLIDTLYLKSNTGSYLCYYISLIPIPNSLETISSIVLPDNFDIHICSITFCN